ncbi:MAG TPA: tetratricopeptide repeat protein [Tepidisphaeraceae bacterium]|nr:tetratricopeptide repeat protein [Tepidisphaeraceae bacterium]
MPPDSVGAALQAAIQHQRSGHLQEAEQICLQIVAQEPANPDALHMLGVLAMQQNQHDTALDWLSRAIAIQPDNAIARNNLGSALRAKDRMDEAIACFQRAVDLKPDFVPAQSNLGNALRESGQPEKAIPFLQRAADLQPYQVTVQYNLGNALRDAGRLDEAIPHLQLAVDLKPRNANFQFALGNAFKDKKQLAKAIFRFRQAIELQLDLVEARINLGSALFEQERYGEAIKEYEAALAIQPDHPQACFNLGNALRENQQYEQAAARYRQALSLTPDYAEIHNNLGTALSLGGQDPTDESIACYRRAIELKPELAEAHDNLGAALGRLGHFQEALLCFQKVLSINPDNADAHLMSGLLLLLHGNLIDGWREYEWRVKVPSLYPPSKILSAPRWDGSDLDGRTLLIHMEQGLGDTLQFSRYLPMIVERGGNVVFACQPTLLQLMQRSLDNCSCIPEGAAVPPYHIQCPLMSLPFIFSTALNNVPHQVPYLRTDPAEAAKWRSRIEGTHDRLKVGLVWAGNKDNKNDRHRSIPLSMLAPLMSVTGVKFYSLQKGEQSVQLKQSPEMDIIDWTDELETFDQTAGLVQNLDMVISVDTAVAHLAGALGKPVWTLLPYVPDWRWMLDRDDSPWYPTMRLFRQKEIGDWTSVIRQIAEALSNWVKSSELRPKP